MGVLTVGQEQPPCSTHITGLSLPCLATGSLTFEQQKETLMLQLEHNKMKQQAEIEKQLAVEKMHYQTEQTKLSLQQYRDFLALP